MPNLRIISRIISDFLSYSHEVVTIGGTRTNYDIDLASRLTDRRRIFEDAVKVLPSLKVCSSLLFLDYAQRLGSELLLYRLHLPTAVFDNDDGMDIFRGEVLVVGLVLSFEFVSLFSKVSMDVGGLRSTRDIDEYQAVKID